MLYPILKGYVMKLYILRAASLLLPAVLILLPGCRRTADMRAVEFMDHSLTLRIDPADHSAEISDSGSVNLNGELHAFLLKENAEIKAFRIGDRDIELHLFDPDAEDSAEAFAALPAELRGQEADIYVFRHRSAADLPFSLSYKAEFFEDVENTSFSNRRVGREIRGNDTAARSLPLPCLGLLSPGQRGNAEFCPYGSYSG